jgi:hypothetical protein
MKKSNLKIATVAIIKENIKNFMAIESCKKFCNIDISIESSC